MTNVKTRIDLENIQWTVEKLEDLFGGLDCPSLCIDTHWYDPKLGVVLDVSDSQAPRDICNYFQAQELKSLDTSEPGDDNTSCFLIGEAVSEDEDLFLVIGGILSTGQYTDEEYDGYFDGHFYVGTREQAEAATKQLEGELDSWHIRLLDRCLGTLPIRSDAISRANKDEIERLIRHIPTMMQTVNAILQRQNVLPSTIPQA